MDIVGYIREQMEFSAKTFGPGQRLEGVTEHISKELDEVLSSGGRDVSEWADVAILAFDGAWRSGFSPEEFARALRAKLDKNKARTWPDWRTAGPGPIEHVRGGA